MVESILLATTAVTTFAQDRVLTNATGFFFERDGRLFLVTSRHVLFDKPSGHAPDRIEIEFHVDPANLASAVAHSILLYWDGTSTWRQAEDAAGPIDVAVLEIDRTTLSSTAVYHAFTPAHLPGATSQVEVGTAMSVVGFPLGFHDTLHHLPVVRHAVAASSLTFRFQGQGYFLTDARMHRGTSGAPVVVRDATSGSPLPWTLLGIHSARLDVGTREVGIDEMLGLNCAWFADILLTLTNG
jgi:hypothetical protein